MRKKIAKRKKEVTAPMKNVYGILFANLIGIVILILLSFFCSLILLKVQVMPDSLIGYFIGCITIGSFMNGFIASKRCSIKGIVSGAISSISFSLVVTVIMLFFTKGQLEPKTIIVYLIIVIASILGGICGANTKRRR